MAYFRQEFSGVVSDLITPYGGEATFMSGEDMLHAEKGAAGASSRAFRSGQPYLRAMASLMASLKAPL